MGGDTKSHTSGARRSQLWIRKTSAANGDPLWKKDNLYLGGQQNDVCNALLINHEGALLAAGYSNRPGKGDDAWILQFDNRPKAPEVRSDLLKIDSLAFYEWDQNAEINPGERAYIGFQITNENRSLFTGLYAEVRQTHGVKGISIVPNLVFPGLRPQSTTFASIPLIGAESLTQGDNIFEIVFRNAAGYEIKRFTIDIKSNKRPKPELHISEARFETAHGGATTRSETIKLTFKLENSGNQTASQVAIRTNISGDALLEMPLQKIGDLPPYSEKIITVNFVVPESYPSDTVSVFCVAEDGTAQYADNGKYTLVLNEAAFVLTDSMLAAGAPAIYWAQEFGVFSNAVLEEKNITLKAILLSDKELSRTAVTILRNGSEKIPLGPTDRLVPLQAENGFFVYKLYRNMALQRDTNTFQVSFVCNKGTATTPPLTLYHNPPKPNLYVYSFGVPLAEEGLQYSVQDASDFVKMVEKNKAGDYFQTVKTTLLTKPEETKFYPFRNMLKKIRDDARLNQYRPGDLLIVYISTQSTDKFPGAFHIKSADYDGLVVEISALNYEENILYYLDDPAINCNKLLILDAFSPKSPDIEDETEDETPAIEDPATLCRSLAALSEKQKNGLITLTSCSPGENSYETSAWENSALVKAMESLFSD